MRRLTGWKRWTVFMVLTLSASLAAYHLGSLAAVGLKQEEQKVPVRTVNGLYIDPQSLDLGEVWENPRHPFRLTIQNVGSVPRSIGRFATSCDCLEVEPARRTIEPGEKAELTAYLDLIHRLSYQMGVSSWPISVRLNPVFEGDFASTPGWEVKGVVRSRVSISTANLAYEDRCSYGGPRVWRKVRARAYVPLKALKATVVPRSAEVRVEPSAETPGDYLVFVAPNPSLSIGRFHCKVQLQAVTLDGVAHPCSTIEVGGEMQHSARVVPRMVLLGEHPIPSEAEADVTVRLPASDWKIDHIETDTTETLVKQSKSDSEAGVRLHITQRIRQPGDGVSIVRIAVRKPDKQVEIVPVEIRYYGRK